MELKDKLIILSDSAKYDASCSSSGSLRNNKTSISGICHSYSSDGRCVSLLKILMTNMCIYDCKYCINRRSNNVIRTMFTPEEICSLTINFYKRNYIEGLFLSSGIIKSPDYTMEKLIETIYLLRNKYKFNGYIHVKAIPGSSEYLIKKLGALADRMSVNIELPKEEYLQLLAPDKKNDKVINVMNVIKENRSNNFVRGGQSTQMIIGASKETDFDILNKSEDLYNKYKLKRVFYSAYVPVNKDNLLPSIVKPPLKRENRLYQADWLFRFYNYKTSDLLDKDNPNFNLLIDPKADYALRHMELFPMELNKVCFNDLIKIPGIGIKSAKKIISARKTFKIEFNDLKKMNISIKRAKYFILCNGKYFIDRSKYKKDFIISNLMLEDSTDTNIQLSLFDE